jgi:hypothetical protein
MTTPTNASGTGALLPCPFCGGEASADGETHYREALADTHWADGSDITEAFFVNCIKCGITNGRPGLVGGYQTKDEAIERWNARHKAEGRNP